MVKNQMYKWYFQVMKNSPAGRDCVHSEYNGGGLSDARAYAIKLFRRYNLDANGYVSLAEVDERMLTNYIGDVSSHRVKGKLNWVWYPVKKYAIYKLNTDGTLGQNYLK